MCRIDAPKSHRTCDYEAYACVNRDDDRVYVMEMRDGHRNAPQRAMTTNGYGQAYETGFERTVRFLISRGAHRDSAQEIAQAAWVRGLERLRQLREDNMVLAWVNTIALNAYRRVLQKEILLQPLKNLPSNSAVDAATIDLDRALKACRPSERTLLEQNMRGFTTKEIARDQGVSETAIRIRLLRARRAARLQMETSAGHRSRKPPICKSPDRLHLQHCA
jgi:DNA-directed RNA polymerase specialized sigma24 family protein